MQSPVSLIARVLICWKSNILHSCHFLCYLRRPTLNNCNLIVFKNVTISLKTKRILQVMWLTISCITVIRGKLFSLSSDALPFYKYNIQCLFRDYTLVHKINKQKNLLSHKFSLMNKWKVTQQLFLIYVLLVCQTWFGHISMKTSANSTWY